jgi:xanthine/CO dehydrogenase XdhC/CoxF family maturation factor
VAELDAIVAAIEDWIDRAVPFALATVVGVRGSTYRGLAARQLMALDGTSIGTVSGGCLDQDVAAIAARVAGTGVPETVEFDLTSDDEAVWGWGIGCNGATRLLVEPAEGAAGFASMIREIRAGQRPTAVVHSIGEGIPGRRALVTLSSVEGSLPAGAVEEARAAIEIGWHRVVEEGPWRFLVEVVGAPSRLIVFGAGHDATPLAASAALLGFEVIVADERRQFLTEERFASAKELIQVEAGGLAAAIGPDPRTYVVLMSHNYLRDLAALRSLLGTDVAYIGALGPGQRLGRLLADLRREGAVISEADLDKLHGPAGLDIGAEGPVEIAWSVMSEVLAVRRGRPGGRLRVRKGPTLASSSLLAGESTE